MAKSGKNLVQNYVSTFHANGNVSEMQQMQEFIQVVAWEHVSSVIL